MGLLYLLFYLDKNLFRCHFTDYNCYVGRLGIEPGPSPREAGD